MTILEQHQEHKPNLSEAERIFRLFEGNPAGHGEFIPDAIQKPGSTKVRGKTQTIRDMPPSQSLWEEHLSGKRGLGVIPVLERGVCRWACIDIDEYGGLYHADLVKDLDKREWPGIVCRSKSGGAHIFFFFREPIKTEKVRAKLRSMAVALGQSADTEIFPKQSELAEGEIGNWLNMPYFDADRGTRYAVLADSRGITLYQFLETAEARRITEAQFDAINVADAPIPSPQRRDRGPLRQLTREELKDYDKNKITAGGARVLATAVKRIRAAGEGMRDNTNNAMAFWIGRYVGGGEIAYDIALKALLEAVLSRADHPERPSTQREQRERTERRLRDGQKEPVRTDTDANTRWATLHKMKHLAPFISVEEILAQAELTDNDTARLIILSNIEERRVKNIADSDVTLPVVREYKTDSAEQARSLIGGFPSGVHVVRAPLGSGKTKVIAGAMVDQAKALPVTSFDIRGRHRVEFRPGLIAGFHRQMLTSEFASKQGITDYKKAGGKEASQLAVCVPSIGRQDFERIRDEIKYLIIEEGAQFYDFVTANMKTKTRSGTDIPAEETYKAWVKLIEKADTVLVLDAEINNAAVEWLEEIRGKDAVTLYRVEMPKKTDRIVEYVIENQKKDAVYSWLLSALKMGERIWVSCESVKEAEAITKKLKEEGINVLGVWRENKLAPEQKAFIDNAETESLKYDAVVHSPVIDSGISIEHLGREHFTAGVFVGGGHTITPRSAYQMLGRVRYLKRFMLFLDPNNRIGEPEDLDYYRRNLGIVGEMAGKELTEYAQRCLQTELRQQVGKRNFVSWLLWRLKESGAELRRVVAGNDPAMKAEIKTLKEELRKERIARIVKADVITRPEADRIDQMTVREQKDIDALRAFSVRNSLNTRELDDDLVRRYLEKDLVKNLDYLWAALGNEMPRERDGKPRLYGWVLWQPVREAYERVFAGIDWIGRAPDKENENEKPLFPALSLEDIEMIASRVEAEKAILSTLGMMPGGKDWPKTDLGKASAFFRRMGLRIARVRTGKDNVIGGYTITGPEDGFGFDDMHDLAHLRWSPTRWDSDGADIPEFIRRDVFGEEDCPI